MLHNLLSVNNLKRLFVYCFGMFIMALGVSISVKSNLGVSPINAIPYALSLVSGFEMGRLTTIFFTFLIAIQALILRRNFSPVRLLQILCSVLFGSFVTLTNSLLSPIPAPQPYPLKLLWLAVSIVCVALGMLFYLSANIIPLPAEGVMQVVSEKSGMKFSSVKVAFDCTVVVIAAIITLAGIHRLSSVREGTVIAAIGVGKVLGFFISRFESKLLAFLGIPPKNTPAPQNTAVAPD